MNVHLQQVIQNVTILYRMVVILVPQLILAGTATRFPNLREVIMYCTRTVPPKAQCPCW